MTHVTCRLTAKNRDQLRNRTLGNRVWATFTFLRVGCGGADVAVVIFRETGAQWGGKCPTFEYHRLQLESAAGGAWRKLIFITIIRRTSGAK